MLPLFYRDDDIYADMPGLERLESLPEAAAHPEGNRYVFVCAILPQDAYFRESRQKPNVLTINCCGLLSAGSISCVICRVGPNETSFIHLAHCML